MNDDISEKDLRLNAEGDEVFMVEFSVQWFLFQLGNARVTLRAPFRIVWQDGSDELFDPRSAASNPASARLLAALMGSRVSRSVAGMERAYLRLSFDNDMHIEYDPRESVGEDWDATDPYGVFYVALPDGDLTWFENEGSPSAD